MPWGIGDVRLRGDVRGYEPGEYSVFYEHSSGAVTVFHRPSATMAFWVIDPRLSPWYERGAPLRSALHHWAAGQGMQLRARRAQSASTVAACCWPARAAPGRARRPSPASTRACSTPATTT